MGKNKTRNNNYRRKNNKRPYPNNHQRHHYRHHSSSSSSPPPHPNPPQPKKPHSSSSSLTPNPHPPKRPAFSSYLDTNDLPVKVKLLCQIVANTDSLSVENTLQETGIRVTQNDVEQVLKLSYSFPGSAVNFFRWSGHQLNDNHSPYAWNLVIDLLGKNSLFQAMWDAILSMKSQRLLSMATFASVFSSFVIAGRVQDAIDTFRIMEEYGFPRDIIALNSLLSAICRDGKTIDAVEFLRIEKEIIKPDIDTFAILLEGWENEGNVAFARQTFKDMVIEIGWEKTNVPAYDSFLCTLLKGPDGFREAMKFLETIKDRGCCPGVRFFKAALEDCLKNRNGKGASLLWEAMVRKFGFKPDIDMYNSVISLYCLCNDIDLARKLLDEMVYHGEFPNSQIYNVMLQFLLKSRKLKEAAAIFTEMIKNEFVPNHDNCSSAVRIYMDTGDYNMGIKVWKCMIENYSSESSDLDETGNLLVVNLCDINRVPEAVKYAEDMIDRRMKVKSSTLSKLRQGLAKAGRQLIYDDLFRKWKFH